MLARFREDHWQPRPFADIDTFVWIGGKLAHTRAIQITAVVHDCKTCPRLFREFSPQGVHVVHTIIDGMIDAERARTHFADYVSAKGDDGFLQLDAIAQTY